jgi:hypothetical protein
VRTVTGHSRTLDPKSWPAAGHSRSVAGHWRALTESRLLRGCVEIGATSPATVGTPMGHSAVLLYMAVAACGTRLAVLRKSPGRRLPFDPGNLVSPISGFRLLSPGLAPTGRPRKDIGGGLGLYCSDLDTQPEAQRFCESRQPGDPHGMDGNNDGKASESLPNGWATVWRSFGGNRARYPSTRGRLTIEHP